MIQKQYTYLFSLIFSPAEYHKFSRVAQRDGRWFCDINLFLFRHGTARNAGALVERRDAAEGIGRADEIPRDW